jgi:hypothetical protein
MFPPNTCDLISLLSIFSAVDRTKFVPFYTKVVIKSLREYERYAARMLTYCTRHMENQNLGYTLQFKPQRSAFVYVNKIENVHWAKHFWRFA